MTIKLLLLLIIMAITSVQASNDVNSKEPLVIFHIDLNSVSLQENYIKKWLKNVADMGYNAILWEIENEVQWETCPECISPDAFSKDTFRNLLKYASKLGLEAIPLFQTIGHVEYVLRHEKYFTFREDSTRYDCYCTTNPAVRDFLKDWIIEYLNLFGDISYFHLGGDEAYAFATCPVCSLRSKEIGENHLYAEHMIDIAQPLMEKGIRPGVWSDMILQHPEEMSAIPKDFVIWDWNYWDGDQTPEQVMVWSKQGFLKKNDVDKRIINQHPEIMDEAGNLRAFFYSDFLKRLGYDVILASATRSHGDSVFAGRDLIHTPNIIGAAKKTIETQLLGNCVTSWAIRIPNYETQYQWLYLAPLTINNPHLSKKQLLTATSEKLFGLADDSFFKAISTIGYSFPFANKKSTGIQWTNLKDSRPAPKRYIEDLIRKWKLSNKGEKWTEYKQLIEKAPQKIAEGLTLLNEFIPNAKKGSAILHAWSKAGYFQYWQALVANEIVNHHENNSPKRNEEISLLIKDLRSDYKRWAETWMTPQSAEINTGLIFDAIIEYFSGS